MDKKYNFVKEITKVESIKRTELSEKKLDSVVHMQANSQEMKCIYKTQPFIAVGQLYYIFLYSCIYSKIMKFTLVNGQIISQYKIDFL